MRGQPYLVLARVSSSSTHASIPTRPSSALSSARVVTLRGAEVIALISAIRDDSASKWPASLIYVREFHREND